MTIKTRVLRPPGLSETLPAGASPAARRGRVRVGPARIEAAVVRPPCRRTRAVMPVVSSGERNGSLIPAGEGVTNDQALVVCAHLTA